MAGEHKENQHTLEAGRETGSNAKWLIRRSCRCDPFSVCDNSFNFSSLPDNCREGSSSRLGMLVGSISSFADANRTVGDAVESFLALLKAEALI
jgi:hypothetical protein